MFYYLLFTYLLLGHTEKECNINEEIQTEKTKKIKKRKVTDEKVMINNIKKKKIDDSREFENEKKTSITKSIKKSSNKLEIKKKKEKTTEVKLKTLKKPKLLKISKKVNLHNQSNGIVNTKKKVKKQET